MKNLIQSVLLLIAVLVSTTGAQEVIYAQVGETVTVQAPVITSKKYVYWFFEKVDGLQLAWSNHLGGKGTTQDGSWKDRLSLSQDSLIIGNMHQENFGTYFCKLTLNDGTTSITTYKLLKLTVNVNPKSPVLPGEYLSLTCKAETLQGHKAPETHWLNPRGEKKITNQHALTVIATTQDNGQWTCVVTKAKKEAKVSVTVVDLSPAPLHPQYTSESQRLTVPCSLPAHISWAQIKAKDIQEVHWHYVPKPGSTPQTLFSLSLEDPLTWKEADQDRGLRPVPDLQKGKLSLTRNRGKEEDRGDYVCALKFKNGVTLNRTVHVKVLQITSSPGTELISGQQLNLSCSFGEPLPSDLQLKWFPPEQSSLSLTPGRHPDHLIIPEVGTGDGGKWKCELWRSDARLTSAEIRLKIEPKLSVWMLVVICSAAVIVILLLIILVFILYRRRQQRMRHLGRRLCQCKTPKPKGFYRT